MEKQYFVVTNPEDGWDCVGGIYLAKKESDVVQALADERGITVKEFNNELIVHGPFKIEEV